MLFMNRIVNWLNNLVTLAVLINAREGEVDHTSLLCWIVYFDGDKIPYTTVSVLCKLLQVVAELGLIKCDE